MILGPGKPPPTATQLGEGVRKSSTDAISYSPCPWKEDRFRLRFKLGFGIAPSSRRILEDLAARSVLLEVSSHRDVYKAAFTHCGCAGTQSTPAQHIPHTGTMDQMRTILRARDLDYCLIPARLWVSDMHGSQS